MSHKKRTNYFLLLGVLVLLGTVATMILGPVFMSARVAGMQGKNMSNAHKQWEAISMYCTDYDERFPTANFNED